MYNGADLYNPEYPDEAKFLLRTIERTLPETTDFWTGVFDDNGDDNPFYKVGVVQIKHVSL